MPRALALVVLLTAFAAEEPRFEERAEFHFVRLEYTDLPQIRRGWSRGWWRQDWPEAEMHFIQGIRRLTRIDTGAARRFRLTDPQLFDHPWIYATQAGYWDLSPAEIARLREYLLKGGFLVVDDFYGAEQWEVFRDALRRALPEETAYDIDDRHALLHVLYDIRERTFIPGLRHLRNGVVVQPPGQPPAWRAIEDGRGRVVVAINYNMDVGDAWEHADWPQYPEAMTSLAYRVGINGILYAITH